MEGGARGFCEDSDLHLVTQLPQFSWTSLSSHEMDKDTA